MAVTVVIPAYNEAERITRVIEQVHPFADEVLVVDDGSQDETADISRKAGATVLTHRHQGYIQALKHGFQSATNDIIVTLDADGEHDPSDIPRVVEPIEKGDFDLVLGKRDYIPSVSERFIGRLVRIRTPVGDHGTGFRAMTRELAVTLDLKGKCTCGTLVLEAFSKKARITEVPITIRKIHKKRKIKWNHLIQILYVVVELIKSY